MANKKSNNGSGALKIAAIGAGAAGLAAAAYFFLGPEGKKNQKHLKSWALKMKADVIERLEDVKDISEPVYNEIIDSISKEYEKGMKASKEEIAELSLDLKKHWKTISEAAKEMKDDVKADAKKVAEKIK